MYQQVIKKDPWQERIYVSYLHWDSKFDEWIANIAERIAPLHTHTYYRGGKLKVGQRIEVLDERDSWLESFVEDEEDDKVSKFLCQL